jgi:uncharacterized protein YgbK (DUF1537 family)
VPQLLIVADDLTGATDTGGCFAARGLETVIPLAFGAPIDADVVVLSTETRDSAGDDAASAVAKAVVGQMAVQGAMRPRWIYKKIDSALRGNPREELLAVMAASGEPRALVAPAFPAQGRTTVGGRQFVDGLPLADSPMGGERSTSDIAAVFASDGVPTRVLGLAAIRDQPDELAAILEAEAAGIVIADAATEDDLLALARATRRTSLRLLCGTAGFARALVHALPLRPASTPHPRRRPVAHPILIVAGSQNEATRCQIDRLATSGVPIVRPGQSVIDGTASIDDVVREVKSSLARGAPTVLTTAGLAPSPLGGKAVAERLAQIAASPRLRGAFGGLVLTGGDVAAAVCAALDGVALWLGGEISPGQPWGILENRDGARIPVATKAGSFGDERALLEAAIYLTSAPSGPRQ